MAIRNDYLQDMISRFVSGLTEASRRAREGLAREAREGYEDVAAEVLDMDAATVLALAPESLLTMVQISAVDERLAAYLAFSLARLAELDEAAADPVAQVRRAQAAALADAYGFDVNDVPPELETALSGEEHKL